MNKDSIKLDSQATSFNRASDVYNNVSKNLSSEAFDDEEEEDDFGTPKISARRTNKQADTFAEGFDRNESSKKGKKGKKKNKKEIKRKDKDPGTNGGGACCTSGGGDC